MAKLPFSQYDLSSQTFFSDPESVFGRMRDSDPVYFSSELSAWVLTNHADISAALKDGRLSVDRNGEIGRCRAGEAAPALRSLNSIIASWMVFSDPPRHTRLRAAVAEAFQPQALRRFVPTIEAIVDELLDELVGLESFDVLSQLGVPLAERVTAAMLGLEPEGTAQLKSWTEKLFGFVGAANAKPEEVDVNARGVNDFQDYVRKVVRARQKGAGDDLISRLVTRSGGDLNEEEIVGLVITLVAGAYETTAHSVTTGLYLLLSHPTQLRLLRDHENLIESAVEEMFRFEGPALGVQRRAKSDLTIRGVEIKERDRIYCMLHAANRDPAEFKDPWHFDIRRQPCRHLGLGLGPHFCLGAWLTRLETQCAIRKVLHRFPSLHLDDSYPIRWTANYAIRGLSELVVTTKSSQKTVPVPALLRGAGANIHN